MFLLRRTSCLKTQNIEYTHVLRRRGNPKPPGETPCLLHKMYPMVCKSKVSTVKTFLKKEALDMSNKLVTPCGKISVQKPLRGKAVSKNSTELNGRAHLVSASVRIRKSPWIGHIRYQAQRIQIILCGCKYCRRFGSWFVVQESQT